jgi:hypothetical protein
LCTPLGIAIDCVLIPFLPQHTFRRRDIVSIPQREEETSRAVIARLMRGFRARLPHPRSDAAEHMPACVHNECQSVRVAVTSVVELLSRHTVTTARP